MTDFLTQNLGRRPISQKLQKVERTRYSNNENLTSKRYSLLRKCIEQHGRENCWTLDGRIYFKVGETVKIVTKKADLER